jgi:hypothetical protein
MSTVFFVILTNFITSIFLYGKFTTNNPFPSVSTYLSYSAAWSTALNDLGGTWSFLGYSFAFIEDFFVGFLSIFVFIYNIFTFLYLAVVWIFAFISFPFNQLPIPFNTLMNTILYAMIGISFVFAIRVFYTGLSNE